jgi:ubiquinone/menaquinone biosynthesis C-methylase UbiE
MLREILHLVRHMPATLLLRRQLTQTELYDVLMQRANEAGFAQERRCLVADLSGDVVELGCGTGLMFPYYADSVRLLAIDLDEDFLVRAHERAPLAAARIEVRQASAEAIPVGDGSQDAVVVSLMLCSVDNLDRVLGEVQRVLKPTGKLVLLEHVRSHGIVAGPLMDLLDPVWLYLNRQGCHMNRRPIEKLVERGFVIEEAVPFQVFAAGLPAFPMRRIRARFPAEK